MPKKLFVTIATLSAYITLGTLASKADVSGDTPAEQSQYGSRSEKKKSYGGMRLQRSTYGKVKGNLSSNKVLEHKGEFCIPTKAIASKYVSAVCITNVKVEWHSRTLMGEPVFNYTSSYQISCLYFRDEYGAPGDSRARRFCNSVRSPAERRVSNALANQKLVDMDIAAGVYSRADYTSHKMSFVTPNNRDRFAFENYLESNYPPKRIVIADTGALKGPNEGSFNVAGSPNWNATFFSFAADRRYYTWIGNLDWPIAQLACRAHRNRQEAEKAKYAMPEADAKETFKSGFVMKHLGICSASLGSLSDLNANIQNWCAALISGGAKNFSLSGPPCRGNEKPTFGQNLVASNVSSNPTTGKSSFNVSGRLASTVMGRDVALTVRTGRGATRLNLNRNNGFAFDLPLVEGRNNLTFDVIVDGVEQKASYFVTYDPSLFVGPFTRFKIGGRYGFKDAQGRVAIEPQYKSAGKLFNGYGCVSKNGSDGRFIVSIDGPATSDGYTSCDSASVGDNTIAFILNRGRDGSHVYLSDGKSLRKIITSSNGFISFSNGGIEVEINTGQKKTEPYTKTYCGKEVKTTRTYVLMKYETYNFSGKLTDTSSFWRNPGAGRITLQACN